MRRIVAILAAAGILLAGCGGTAATAQPARTVLNLGMPKPLSLDSITAMDASSIDILAQVEQGLVTLNAQGVPQPGIAAKWSTANGGKVYTFDLRAAKWSNGDPVTAQDFVYGWEQTLDPCNQSPNASALAPIAGASSLLSIQCTSKAKGAAQVAAADKALGIKAVSPTELQVTLATPTWYWLAELAGPAYYPLDASAVGKWGISHYGDSLQHLLFDGPFTVTTWQPSTETVLSKNQGYWDASTVRLTQVHLYFGGNTGATNVDAYSNGTLDGIVPFVPNAFVHQYQGKPEFYSVVGNIVTFLMANTTDPVLKDVYIRRALSEALDRQSLMGIEGANAAPATAFTPPSVDYAPNRTFGALIGNVLSPAAQAAQAKADLQKGLKQLGLTKLPALSVLIPNQGATGNIVGPLNAFWSRTLGITVSTDAVSPAKYVQDLGTKKYQLAYLTWQGNYNDPKTFLDLFTPGSQNELSPWTNKAFTADMQQAQTAATLAARGADLAAAEKEMLSRMPVIPLSWPRKNWVLRPYVHGYVEYAQGNVDFSLGLVSMT